MTMLYLFGKAIASILAVIMTLFTLGSGTGELHTVKAPEEHPVVFSVLSDAHIEGLDQEFTFTKSYGALTKVLDDVSLLAGRNDALVFLGDNTMNGQNIENLLFYGLVNSMNPADKIIVTAGNHDFSNGEGDYEEYKNRFLYYNNAFFTKNLTEPYYYQVVKGCYIICLSSEDATVNDMYLSDTQLSWLKSVLDEAAEKKAPIFVMSHHPADYLAERSSDELTDILNDYDNLLYFCGHTHREYDQYSVYTLNGVDCINLPKVTHKDEAGTGIGAQVEVYDDEIVVRIRDFYNGYYLEGQEFIYPIG
ncbi:MAG: metallophosphoesterase [Clostridia bacterium]|nr:metallophosphoesterase [Clostridia bacterium]